MKAELILYPMLCLFLLTFIVVTLGYINRIRAVRQNGLSLAYFKYNSGGKPPESMRRTDQNYTNLFEMPVIFYAAVITSYVTSHVDLTSLVLAWLFVASRYAHSYIHISRNNIMHRLRAFLAGLIVLMIFCAKLSFELLI